MAYFLEIIARLRNDIEFHVRLEMRERLPLYFCKFAGMPLSSDMIKFVSNF